MPKTGTKMVPETGTKNAHKMQPASQKKPASRRKIVNQNFVKTNWAKYGTGPKNEHHGATVRYISLSTLFGVSFGAQSWDPKLVVLRPQVLASSRRSKSHHTIGMITTHFGLYKWSVWGTPFIQSIFFAQGPGFRA